MLSFQIDQSSDVPVWAQLARRIAYLIETGGTVVMPSSFSEGFGDVLGDSMKGALKKAHS